jgi:integrase
VADGFWPLVEWAVNNRPAYVTLRRHWCQACHEVGLGVVQRTDGKKGADSKVVFIGRWPQKFKYAGMRLHDLRHSYAQVVSAAGLPLSQLKSALGQGSESSSARYAAQVAGRQAAQLAGQALGGGMALEVLWPSAAEIVE